MTAQGKTRIRWLKTVKDQIVLRPHGLRGFVWDHIVDLKLDVLPDMHFKPKAGLTRILTSDVFYDLRKPLLVAGYDVTSKDAAERKTRGINEQELHVCREIVGTLWDIGTPYYFEVVARIVKDDRIKRHKLFSSIKEIEDTIQILVHKGILSQEINYIGKIDKNGNTRWRYDEPHIVLSFTKDPSEMMIAISEIFGQMIKSFIGSRISYANNST